MRSSSLNKRLKMFFNQYGLLSLPLSLLGIFFILPALNLIYLSFRAPGEAALTMQHYMDVAHQPVYRTTFIRSITLSLKCAALSLVLGYPFAYILSNTRPTLRAILTFIVALPLVLNLLNSSFAWMVILQRKGVLNWFLLNLNLVTEPITLLFTEGATLTGMVYVVLPLMILPILSTLLNINSVYAEASHTLGAGPGTTFWKITFPLSMPGIVAGGLLVFISSFGLYLVPELLGGPTLSLLPYLIQQQTLQFLNWQIAAALSVILVLFIIPALIVLQRVFWNTTYTAT